MLEHTELEMRPYNQCVVIHCLQPMLLTTVSSQMLYGRISVFKELERIDSKIELEIQIFITFLILSFIDSNSLLCSTKLQL